MITIDQQVIIVDRRPVLADPKTFSSLRGVPMPAFLLRAVTGHCGQFALTGNDVLCRTGRGTLLRRDYFNREIWKPAIAAAQLPEDTTFHDLRHTFASTALAEGVPISEVSRWLGHKSITTTVDLYGTWSRRPVAAPGMRWTRHSPERACVPPMCPRMLPSSAEMQVRDVGGGRAGM